MQKIGSVAGFSFSYLLFTAIIFFIFSLSKTTALAIPAGIIATSLVFKKLFT